MGDSFYIYEVREGLHRCIPVIAFEKTDTWVFESISDAAVAYGVNKKVIIDRINDGCTLKDGYTTLDWYSPEEETVKELREIREYIPKNDSIELD
jgi:hypothetical protein